MSRDLARQFRIIKTTMLLTLSLGLLLAAIFADAIFPFKDTGFFPLKSILLFVIFAMLIVPGLFRLVALALTRLGIIVPEDLPETIGDG